MVGGGGLVRAKVPTGTRVKWVQESGDQEGRGAVPGREEGTMAGFAGGSPYTHTHPSESCLRQLGEPRGKRDGERAVG